MFHQLHQFRQFTFSNSKWLTALVLPVGLVAVISTTSAGCSSPCEKFYDISKKCAGDRKAPDKADFLKECKKNKKELKPMLDCTKHSSCDKYKSCVKKAYKKMRKAEASKNKAALGKKVAAMAAKKDWKSLLSECSMAKDDLSAEAKKTCTAGQLAFIQAGLVKGSTKKQIDKVLSWCNYSKADILSEEGKKACKKGLKVHYDRLAAEALKIRDNGPYKSTFKLRYALKNAAKKLGADTIAKATELASDIEVAATLHDALTAVKKVQKSGKVSIPFNCSYALKKVEKVKQTAFVKGRKAVLIKACYITLGKPVLEKMLKARRKYCSYHAGKVYKAVVKYQLKDPAIDELIEKTQKVCDKKKK